jgi:hypothetical protein
MGVTVRSVDTRVWFRWKQRRPGGLAIRFERLYVCEDPDIPANCGLVGLVEKLVDTSACDSIMGKAPPSVQLLAGILPRQEPPPMQEMNHVLVRLLGG